MLNAALQTAAPYLPFAKPFQDGFAARATLLHPEGRGRIRLASDDPRQAPRIHTSLLTTQREIDTFRNGIALIRDIFAQAPMRDFTGKELAPGFDVASDADFERYIRSQAICVHHPVGTCKMGADCDPDAVVDGELHVRGVRSLRVVAASVMPSIVGGNTHAAVTMIAEKASDIIMGREPGVRRSAAAGQ